MQTPSPAQEPFVPCPHCGQHHRAEDRVCPHCGQALRPIEEPRPPSPFVPAPMYGPPMRFDLNDREHTREGSGRRRLLGLLIISVIIVLVLLWRIFMR